MRRPYDVEFPLRSVLPACPAPRTIAEPSRGVPVIAECEVAVLGGGPAGVCAAAAAAREGASVVLVERYGFLGGMATAADVSVLHSLYGTDRRTQVIGGLPEEVIARLRDMGGAHSPDSQDGTGYWVVCTETAKLAFDDLVVGSGVELLLHSYLADAVCEGRRIVAAVIEGKSGRGAVVARTFVDCTGDADLVRRAGACTELGDLEGRCQAPSLCFRVRGVKPGAAPLGQVQADLHRATMDYNGGKYPAALWGEPTPRDPDEWMLAAVRVLDVNAADTRDLTRAEVEARYQLRWVLQRLRSVPGWEGVYLTDIATQIGPRESHRIVADHQLSREEVLHGVRFDDAIAQGTYPIDIHRPDGPGIAFEYLNGTARRIVGDQPAESGRWDGCPEGAPLRDTLCYQVPYRCLIPRDLDNVLVAGRCIGATHESAGAIRVMINCMQFGQAAGVAAVLAGSAGEVRSVAPEALQARLRAVGVPLLTP